jgi:alpha-N-arabinofuranosidase
MLKHCAWILAASLMAGPAWAGDAVFSEVRYHGDDGGPPVGADEYRNPVVAGFYPTPPRSASATTSTW